MSSVFILGAGASCHAGLPTMMEFLEVVEDLHRSMGPSWLEYPIFDLVVRARGQLAAVQSKARFDIRNLETVFSAFEIAAIFRRLGNLPPDDVQDDLLVAMRHVIRVTIEEKMLLPVRGNVIQPPLEYDYFGAFVGELLKKGESVSIITFNYDVGAELGLRKHGLVIDYCLDELPSTDRHRVEVMKLHGSVNWTDCKKCEAILVHAVHDAVGDRKKRFAEDGIPPQVKLDVTKRFGTMEHCEGCHCSPDPILVPPTAHKAGFRKQLNPVWRRAATRLAEAENIFVLGYSWPDSDQFFRQLYALGAVGPVVLRKFWVLNPDRAVSERIE